MIPESFKEVLFLLTHYAAEVNPNHHGQIWPICVSLVRFSYVNILKMDQYCKK